MPHNSSGKVENAIRDALYGELKNNIESDLLKEVRQFCIAAGRNPNIDSIITYNKRHFKNVEKFGLRVLDPKEFLTEIGVIS